VFLHWQERLPIATQAAQDRIYELMDTVLEKDGEGLILRKPESIWTPKRTWDLLKVKPLNDDEAKVIGYVWGKGKYEGMMGAVIVDWHGIVFELSGFTDAERGMECIAAKGIRTFPTPGTKVLADWYNANFPIGSTITFKYRELTNAGVPKEARYYRKK
jgi:DNA ligase 1